MKVNVNELSYKVLQISDIPLLLEVQEEAFEYAKGDTDFLRRNTVETFSLCFGEKSLVLGVFLGEQIIAFGILHAAGDTKENLALDIEEVTDVLQNANVKLIIVRPQYRGNGLQFELIKRLSAHAKECGFTWLSATVAPSNPWSKINFEKCGFKQVKVLQKYGGKQRLLLAKQI